MELEVIHEKDIEHAEGDNSPKSPSKFKFKELKKDIT